MADNAPRQSYNGAPRQSSTGEQPRTSTSGYAPNSRASQSNYKLGPGVAAARQSFTGGGHGSMRRNFRPSSSRRSLRSATGEPGGVPAMEKLQVLDEQGVDRTPKPLMALRPALMRNGLPEDPGTPNSETSELCMDRMSSATFSRAGWYSEANSGAHTPKSEAGDPDEDDFAAQKERARQLALQAAAVMAAAEAADAAEAGYPGDEDEPGRPQGPSLLTDKDLDLPVVVTLCETETIVLFSVPCVTVAVDSEEAAGVEAANERYTQLLASKAGADRYSDQEAQTLNHLKKSREAQSSVLSVTSAGVQASVWDIADTYAHLEEGGGDGDDDRTALPGVPSVSQLAGAAARGDGYNNGAMARPAANGTDTNVRTSMANFGSSNLMRQSSMSVMGNPPRGPSGAGGGNWETDSRGGSALFGAVRGAPPGPAPTDGPAGNGAAAPPPPNPLYKLPRLVEKLELMDHAVSQNNYLPKLLLYRNVQQLHNEASRPGLSRGVFDGADDSASDAGPSAAATAMTNGIGALPLLPSGPSRPVSRGGQSEMAGGAPSERSEMRRLPSQSGTRGGGTANGGLGDLVGLGGGADRPGYAASVAESHWPEELMQDLAEMGDDAPRIEALWEWTCPLVAGLRVACMGWNKANPDLLAVGYSQPAPATATTTASGHAPSTPDPAAGTEVPTRGLVALWSLKDPRYPLWTFDTRFGVTALDFATYSPSILALGLHDGTVAIYDVRRRQGTPAMECDVASGRHADPVWQVRWLDRGPERDEVLVSISTDGRVTQWSIAKGLEHADLMKLKRLPRRPQAGVNGALPAALAAGGASGGAAAAAQPPSAATATTASSETPDAFISRLTSGMSFDFSGHDERIYLAGTEDGWIHKCSTSYSEQYLESYAGHMGPVYNVQWSPFRRDMFISASGDWTVRLWQEGREAPLLTFVANSTEANDVQWCPTNSTVFGSVTGGGRLEVWDFSLSTVKPVMHVKTGVKQSCLRFSPNCPVVVCGGEDGLVRVFRLYNVDREYDTTAEQVERLDEVIKANVMKTQPGHAQA